jgi:hypothetical protein
VLLSRSQSEDLVAVHKAILSLSASRAINDHFMAEHERNCKCDEIWIVTPDLHKDIPLDDEPYCFEEIVFNNITKRGISYTYILCDSSDIVSRISALNARYENSASKPSICKVDVATWNLLPYVDGDFIIYNPRSKPGASTEGYYELPIRGRNQWVKVEDKTVLSWVGRIITAVPSLQNR